MTEILVGFLIAAGVGLTGVGAGSLLAPVLMLFFNVPPAAAVGTALAFSAVIKLTIAPVYIVRKQIHYPTLLRLCCGGKQDHCQNGGYGDYWSQSVKDKMPAFREIRHDEREHTVQATQRFDGIGGF